MSAELVESRLVPIASGQYWRHDFWIAHPDDFALFEINVRQDRGQLDDIKAYVLDAQNCTTWEHNLIALRAGAHVSLLPVVTMYQSVTLHWGSLSFKAPSEGLYHLILDNTYSTFTSKNVNLSFYRLQAGDPLRRAIREIMVGNGWSHVWSCFEEAEQRLYEKKGAACCDSLRRGLLNLWVKVCEEVSGQVVAPEPGKATDVGQLKQRLAPYAPDYAIAPIAQAWSLASELAKTEKRGGQEPPLSQVAYAHRLVLASAGYLISIHSLQKIAER